MSKREDRKANSRRKLIEATIASIAEHGLTSTTVSTVVEGAGLSRGIVNLRFDSKNALFSQTLRYLAEEWRGTWQTALEKAGTSPAGALRAALLATFEPPVFSRKRLAVWHAFWADSSYRTTYRRVCGAADREYRNTLTELSRRLSAESGDTVEPALAADMLGAVVNGLWLDLLTNPRAVTRAHARRVCLLALESVFPAHYGDAARKRQRCGNAATATKRSFAHERTTNR